MTYEEHYKLFFKNNPAGFTRTVIEQTRDTKPIIMVKFNKELLLEVGEI